MTNKKLKCCLCNRDIIGFGNNAQPLGEGICCDECNIKVIIKRLEYSNLMKGGDETRENGN